MTFQVNITNNIGKLFLIKTYMRNPDAGNKILNNTFGAWLGKAVKYTVNPLLFMLTCLPGLLSC